MNLFGDRLFPQVVSGADVFCSRTMRVADEWLSDCERERALTRSLMDKVCDLSNFGASLKRVMKNGGSSGVDGMSTKELHKWFNENYRNLLSDVLEGRYEPDSVERVDIRKPNGGIRTLGIPTVKDRLIQQAISQVLSKHYEPTFSKYSYGFRPKRSAHDALKQASEYVQAGYQYIVDIDLEKFFDEVKHDRLMWLLSRRISDKRLLQLIRKYLSSDMMVGGLVNQRTMGTPQGSPLSPLLSNIVLDELDKLLESRGVRFVRYADDMVIFCKTQEQAEFRLEQITFLIESRLKLKVNRQKSRVCRCNELNYLGHSIGSDGKLYLSRTSERRAKEKLREITKRKRGVSFEQLIAELNRSFRGWLNYFSYACMKKKVAQLGSMMRRRLRAFKLKQCKRAKGMLKFFVSRGLPKWRAILLAGSRKGWMRKSLSPQASESMNLQWFRDMGLIDMDAYYRLNFKGTAQYESTLSGVRGQVGK